MVKIANYLHGVAEAVIVQQLLDRFLLALLRNAFELFFQVWELESIIRMFAFSDAINKLFNHEINSFLYFILETIFHLFVIAYTRLNLLDLIHELADLDVNLPIFLVCF